MCFSSAPMQIIQATETTGLPGSGTFMGTGVSSTGLFNPAATGLGSTSGSYSILYTYTTTKGCRDTASSSVIVWKVTADAGPGLIVFEGNSVTINPVVTGDNLSFAWSPPTFLNSSTIKNPVTTPKNDITYKLTVTGNNSCSAADTVRVAVLKTPVIPNAFSPNNDGINDVWNIQYLSSYADASIEVYNRYGGWYTGQYDTISRGMEHIMESLCLLAFIIT
jgi:hypothetical protein